MDLHWIELSIITVWLISNALPGVYVEEKSASSFELKTNRIQPNGKWRNVHLVEES